MNMTIKGIKDNVQSLLEATDYFVDVQSAPQEGEAVVFSGYPSVSHYYTGTENQPATVSQNRRTINYTVQIVQVVPDTVTSEQEFDMIYDLADNTIQMFDESRDLSSESLNLTRVCDVLRPAPGELERVSTNEGDGLMLTIRLACEADVTR